MDANQKATLIGMGSVSAVAASGFFFGELFGAGAAALLLMAFGAACFLMALRTPKATPGAH